MPVNTGMAVEMDQQKGERSHLGLLRFYVSRLLPVLKI